MDAETIKRKYDLRDVVEKDIGKPHHRGHEYDTYPCPLHNEKHGHSLSVWNDHYWCFGKCGGGGDIFTWYERKHELTFIDAFKMLGGEGQPERPKPIRAPRVETETEPPSGEWQSYADDVVQRAEAYLWGRGGVDALNYLRWRGLTDETIKLARLGFVPAKRDDDLIYGRVLYDRWFKPDGKPVRVPVGITIPHYADGHLWAVRVRTDQEIKYRAIAGGRKALYGWDWARDFLPALLVEGEFDALIAHQVVGDLVNALALGSASNAKIDRRWKLKLLTSPVILARMDDDNAGMKALGKLSNLSSRVRGVNVPIAKDINDYYLGCLRYPTPPPRERFAALLEVWLDPERKQLTQH
jgi:DNA primase